MKTSEKITLETRAHLPIYQAGKMCPSFLLRQFLHGTFEGGKIFVMLTGLLVWYTFLVW